MCEFKATPRNVVLLRRGSGQRVQVQYCFTSTETIIIIKDYYGREAHDGHLDFHTAPEPALINAYGKDRTC